MSLRLELDAAAGRLDQPQHGARHGRFAAAAFADQAERLAVAEREADAVDRIDGAGLRAQAGRRAPGNAC